MLLKDTQIAELIGLTGTEVSIKRRLRMMAEQREVKPVQKCRGFWLWDESDIPLICSKLLKDQKARIGKLQAPIKGYGYGKRLARTTKSKQKRFSESEFRRLTASQAESGASRTQ